jgi:hypothetical protein
MPKVYKGIRHHELGPFLFVVEDGLERDLDKARWLSGAPEALRLDWGADNMGTLQTAIAILQDLLGDYHLSMLLAQDLALDLLEGLPRIGFSVPEECVRAWVTSLDKCALDEQRTAARAAGVAFWDAIDSQDFIDLTAPDA